MFNLKKIIFITIFFLFEAVAFAIPPSFVFQGQITKPNGQSLEASLVTFTLQVLSSTNQCLLYEETHVLNMSGSNGLFSLSTGNGTNTGNGGLADLTTAMNNSLGNQTGLTCASGTAYDPASGDTRRLRITFDDGSGPITVSQDHTIQSVPYAQYAGSLEGKSANEFVQVNSATAGVTQPNLEAIFDNGSNYTELLALLAGTSSNYTPISSSGAGNLPSFTNAAPPASPSAGDVWFNTDSNQILYYDGTSTQPVGSSGTLTSITAGSGLSGGTITTTGTISVTAGGITNAHLASGIDAAKVTTGTLPAGVVPSGTDATKLPLAGGTMTGNITMGGNQVLGASHITQAAQSTITLGSYTNAQETTLVGTLGAANAGATWYNSDSGELKYWDGTAAVKLNNTAASISSVTASSPLSSSGGATPDISINLGNGLYNNGGNVDIDLATDPGLEFNSNKLRVKVNSGLKRTTSGVEADIGTSAGQLIAVDDIPNCTAGQKIQMSAGPVYTLSCVADVDTTLSGSAAGGDLAGNYPNPTIATGAVTTAKLSNSGATAGTYPKVTVDVKGRVTSGTALVASDIPNLDAAKITSGTLATARLDVGTGNNQIVQLDGTSKLPAVDGSQLTNLPPSGANAINDLSDATKTANNLFVGHNGGSVGTSDNDNTAFGIGALNSLNGSDGDGNTASGSSALYSNTTGDGNTASGRSALYSNTTGHNNTASGRSALYFNTTGDYNTASGRSALYSNTTGDHNTASGSGALYSNTTGYSNTASGSSALDSNTTGHSNTASGSGALFSNTTGHSNTASGRSALFNTTGDDNTASGSAALLSNTTGHSNTASGSAALYSNTTGDDNTASGSAALLSNTTGHSNTASGSAALFSNTTGHSNTASGHSALSFNTTGSYNTAIGHGTGMGITTGVNNTIIGARVMGLSSSLSNNVIIADGSGNRRINVDSSGHVGVGTTSPASKLHVDGFGAGGGVCVTSDGTCSAVPTGGQISAETTLNTGADYAEYFESEEDLLKGDIVGLNPLTGKARGYQPGDHLLGLVSTDPGVIGNSDLATQADTVLVALVGQVPFNDKQVIIKGGKILTKDEKPIGYLLASGNAYISLSSADQDQNQKIQDQNQQIQDQNQLVVKQSRQISSLKQENLKKSKSIEDLNKRLEIIEKLMKK